MIYKINRGEHSSGFRFRPHYNLKQLSYEVEFNDSALYDLKSSDQLDINKLFGISFGHHHWHNSIRFGWRSAYPSEKKVEILAYQYLDGKRVTEQDKELTIGFVNPNEEYRFTIQVKENSYWLQIGTENTIEFGMMLPHNGNLCKFGYQLFPYFGGNRTAPHDITISII